MTRLTYHLVPVEVWASLDSTVPYAAASLATEGFIHCTDGAAALIATAERHYASDPRPFLALTVDLDQVGAPWRFDGGRDTYPHVYGPIERRSIVAVAPVRRDAGGRFLDIGPDGSP